jgi:transposase
MARRQFSREFKLEAVRLVKERGVSVVQASRDLDVGENILRRWIKELTADPGQAFPGQGQVKPEQQEIDRLRREVAKLKAERDILKNCRGPGVRLRGEKQVVVGSTWRGAAVGFLVASHPVKKRGPWAVAHLRVVTPPRRSRLGN